MLPFFCMGDGEHPEQGPRGVFSALGEQRADKKSVSGLAPRSSSQRLAAIIGSLRLHPGRWEVAIGSGVGQVAGRHPARSGQRMNFGSASFDIGPDSRHYPASEQRLPSISDTLARKK